MKYFFGIICPSFLLVYLLTFKISFLFITIYLSFCFYLRIFRNKDILFYSPTPKVLEILQKSQLQNFSFKAHFFLPTTFLQTLCSSFDARRLSLQKAIELKAIQFRVPEAETSLDFVYFPWEDPNAEMTKKCLMIIPGLTGSIKDAYIRELCNEALNKDFRPIVLNSRWLAQPVKLPKRGPINFIEDVNKTVNYITEKFKVKQMYGIGISYGSNMLCKYLGTVGRNSDIFKGAVSIGNPFNMYQNARLINRFWNFLLCRILQKALIARKKLFTKTKKASFQFVEVEEALKVTNFMEFDEYFTRRILGFQSLEEYYKRFSCIYDLKNIKVPLLCLQSKDDPISHYAVTPFHESKKNDNLIFYTTEAGGHIGWIEGFFKLKVFYPKPCIQFLSSL